MMKRETRMRAALSLGLALLVAGGFTLSSVAAAASGRNPPAPATAAVAKPRLAVPVGRLTGKGKITVDGYEARTGATVASGSMIETGADASAVVDLGALGRLELGPETAIALTFSEGSVNLTVIRAGRLVQSLTKGVPVNLNAKNKQVRLNVTRGGVDITSNGNAQTLKEGEAGILEEGANLIATGDADIVIEDSSSRSGLPAPKKPGYVSGRRGGFLALAGIGAGVSFGALMNRDSDSTRTLSPVR